MTNEEIQRDLSCGACCTQLINVGVRFGKTTVLEEINLHIHCGEMTVIIGPNGAGKSTLFRAIIGEIPYTGEITRERSTKNGERKNVLGYVPQYLDFDKTAPLTVADLFCASISRRPAFLGHSRGALKKAKDSLSLVDAAHLLPEKIGCLSGGQLQRVLLALALTPMPDLLLLDEPVAGVDPAGIDLFYNMVSNLRRNFDLSIIMVSHDLVTAARHAERMILLNKKIICDGTPNVVLSHEAAIKTFGENRIPTMIDQAPVNMQRHCKNYQKRDE